MSGLASIDYFQLWLLIMMCHRLCGNIIIMYLVLQLKCLNLSFVSVLVLFVFRLCSCIVLGGVGRMVG